MLSVPDCEGFAATVEQYLELVASWRGFVVIPRSTSTLHRRADVAIVPMTALESSHVVLVSCVGDPRPDPNSLTGSLRWPRSVSASYSDRATPRSVRIGIT
ncbi:hypothetical protein ABH922_004482 [Rhodococcus sp. 27YEA15]